MSVMVGERDDFRRRASVSHDVAVVMFDVVNDVCGARAWFVCVRTW